MDSNKSICPVPKDQRPINEYLALKSSFVFSWTSSTESVYYTVFSRICFTLLLFFVLIFNSENYSYIQTLLYSIFSVSTLLSLFYLRIYLGWDYIYNRLMQATVVYEESGWYDGQVWIKSPQVLLKDKLAAKYQVEPILYKIKVTLCTLLLSLFLSLYFIIF